MYLLSSDERRYLQRGVFPDARRQTVADELRGWNWPQPPLKAIYDHPLGVSEVAAGYCPTGRDVYLRRVTGARTLPGRLFNDGQALHRAVADAFTDAKRLIYRYGVDCLPYLEQLSSRSSAEVAEVESPNGSAADTLGSPIQLVRAFEMRRIIERVEAVLAKHRSIGADALAALALPVHVELRVDGRYLGLSQHLAVDAVTFPEGIVMELKSGSAEPFHRLTTTGYALVLESLFEVPIDIGCIVYVRIKDGRLTVERDFHPIDDSLRQTFIEQRDDKMRMIEHEFDPGLPPVCRATCPFLGVCRPAEQSARVVEADLVPSNRPTSANLPHNGLATPPSES
jgi:CRISPR-associated protein Csa1